MPKPQHNSLRLEALLFASPVPVTTSSIATMLELDLSDMDALLTELKTTLSNRAVELVEGPEGWELAIRRDLRNSVAQGLRDLASPLSQSGLEVLAVIAYDGPTTKAHIDDVRGVASDASLRALLGRDLVQAKGGKAGETSYQLTNLALRTLGISHITELPKLPTKKVSATEKAEQDDSDATQ